MLKWYKQIRILNIVLKYILLYTTFFTDPPDLIEGGSYIKPINVSQYNLCYNVSSINIFDMKYFK